MSTNKKPYLRRLFNKVFSLININRDLNELKQQNGNLRVELDDLKFLLAKALNHNILKTNNAGNIQKAEFKIFSQWGDDGIIQYIVNTIQFKSKTFIEFGVENYLESNTRFLLMNDNWSGLVIDGSEEHINYIQQDSISWKYDLKARKCFITKDNINELITSAGYDGEIGILSIDIDGNDYWIWQAITVVKPVLVIIEFNAVFGEDRSITIPYKEDFIRQHSHYSYLYYGASLAALVKLGKEKGYTFIGINSAAVNAYFIKNENLGEFTDKEVNESFLISKFSESRDTNEKLNYLSFIERQECIRGLPVFNLDNNQTELF